MSHILIVTQTDGVYVDNGQGQMFKLDGAVAAYDKQAPNDLIIRVPKVHIREDGAVDPRTAYNFLDPDIRRLAVALGLMTQGEANQYGRVSGSEPSPARTSDDGSTG